MDFFCMLLYMFLFHIYPGKVLKKRREGNVYVKIPSIMLTFRFLKYFTRPSRTGHVPVFLNSYNISVYVRDYNNCKNK